MELARGGMAPAINPQLADSADLKFLDGLSESIY
jgi:hypothetical protein